MSVTRPATVLRDLAALVEAATPYEATGPGDVFRWVPTLAEIEQAPDRTFVVRPESLDEVTSYSCRVWELVATLDVVYGDTPHAQDITGGSAARVLEDARVIAQALRGILGEAYCDDYEALSSSTATFGSQITHSRTFRVRYIEGS
jgi:hypothetical protein